MLLFGVMPRIGGVYGERLPLLLLSNESLWGI
jgi:hypothetical protein